MNKQERNRLLKTDSIFGLFLALGASLLSLFGEYAWARGAGSLMCIAGVLGLMAGLEQWIKGVKNE